MPAGPIGSVWATGTWSDTAWEAGTWADAVALSDGDEVMVTIQTGIQCYVVQATTIGVRVVISSAKQIYVTTQTGTPIKVTI